MTAFIFAFTFGALCMGAFMLWVLIKASEKHCRDIADEYDAGVRDGMNISNSNSNNKNHE
jgi:hypothetical protein